MEIQPLDLKKKSKVKWVILALFICIVLWTLIITCTSILLFTTGDNSQKVPDAYENNGYDYDLIDEPYWLVYPEELEDFTQDKEYLSNEGVSLGPNFITDVMESGPDY